MITKPNSPTMLLGMKINPPDGTHECARYSCRGVANDLPPGARSICRLTLAPRCRQLSSRYPLNIIIVSSSLIRVVTLQFPLPLLLIRLLIPERPATRPLVSACPLRDSSLLGPEDQAACQSVPESVVEWQRHTYHQQPMEASRPEPNWLKAKPICPLRVYCMYE